MSPFPHHGRTLDQRLAEDLAAQCGRMLTALRMSTKHGDRLAEIADEEARSVLLDRLAIARPDDFVMTEENPSDLTRLDEERVWIVDPLDGSVQYRTEGRADWAVHVALWSRDEEGNGDITSCAIGMPAYGRVLSGRGATTYQPPSTIPGQRPAPLVPAREDDRIRIIVSDKEPPAFTDALVEKFGAERLELGSAGAKTASVIEGETDVYVHSSGMDQWNTAAAVGVARQRDFHASRIDGSPLVYNEADAELPDILVCREEIADEVLAAIAEHI